MFSVRTICLTVGRGNKYGWDVIDTTSIRMYLKTKVFNVAFTELYLIHSLIF